MQRARQLLLSAAPALLVACAVLAPLAVHWVRGLTLVWFDSLTLYAPQRWLVDEALRAWRLPLWNPYSGAGMPFFADAIHGVLHPVSVLTAWLNTSRSVDLLIAGHVVCAGVGAWLLARDLGCSGAGAVLAGVAYASSGYVLSVAGNLVFLAGAGSLPLCVAGLRRFANEPRGSSLALGVAGVAALAFSGDAQALMLAGVLAFALAWEAGSWRGGLRAVAAGGAGLLVAGVQLLPSAVHMPRTVRAEALWSASAEWSLEGWRVPELVLPGLMGGEDPYFDPVFKALVQAGGVADVGHPFPFVPSIFVGLLPLTLALVGARAGRRGKLLGALALLLLWIALGNRLGAGTALGWVPVWKAFRYAEKLVGPLTLLLAILSGLGLDALVERRVAGWKVVSGAALLGVAAVVAVRLFSGTIPADVKVMADARLSSAAWHALGALTAMGVWLVGRRWLPPSASGLALACLAWGGMAAGSPAALRPGGAEARLRSPGPLLDAEAPGARIVTPSTIARTPHVPGADRTGEFARDFAAIGHPAYNVGFRIDSLAEYAAMAPPRLALLHSFLQQRWPAAARRYAATHVFLDPAMKDDPALYLEVTGGGVRLPTRFGGDELWAVPHRPWASFAQEVRVVEDWKAAAIATGAAARQGPGVAIVEASSPFRTGPGRVISLERGLEQLRIEAESAEEGTLIVADAFWPGWEATVDGRPVSIFPADVLVRAVRWPAGRHVLEMRYRPPEVRTGVLLSLVGIVLTGVGVLLLRRPRRMEGQVG
jgi:hypothetical protein